MSKSFKVGKRYVVTTKKILKAYRRFNHKPSGSWLTEINGREVSVLSPQDGVVNIYRVLPKWCKEIS